jgi:hypothetical protein
VGNGEAFCIHGKATKKTKKMNNPVENSYIRSKDFEISKLSVVTQLYVWSVIIEPLLFFIVFNPETFGVTANVSKLFQFTIFIYLIIKVLILNRSFSGIPSPFSRLNLNFIYYFIWAVIVGIYGLFIGAYNIENDVFNPGVGLQQQYRPIFEYIILLYYFVYFMILPRYFLNNAISINYFFKVFTIVFSLLLFVGFVDLILTYLIDGYNGLPRHLSDGRNVGTRFHGFAGEPRDAFVYLMFGLCIIALKGIWENTIKPSKILFLLVIIAAILTQSFSGLLGILFFCGLYVMFGNYKLTNYRTYLYLITILFFVAAAIYTSDRILLYFKALITLFIVTKEIESVDTILSVSLNNVYPVWQRFQEVMGLNLLPTIIGTGLGSSSIANINFYNVFEVTNPNANIIRTFFESGIIGSFIFILAFLKPLKRIGASKRELMILNTAMLLMLGMFFGHRSPELFIFFGIVLAVYKVKYTK